MIYMCFSQPILAVFLIFILVVTDGEQLNLTVKNMSDLMTYLRVL